MNYTHVPALTCAPVNQQTGLRWTGRATEVENKAKAVLVSSRGEHGAVELRLVLSLRQPVEGQRTRRGLLRTEAHQCCSTCSDPSTCSSSACILIQQHLPVDVSARWSYQLNRHSPVTATLVKVGVVHQQFIGEDTGQVERTRALHFLRDMWRPEGHLYEVSLREREGAGQLDGLRTEEFDRMSRAGSDLVDAVSPDLVVLYVADLQEEGRVEDAGTSLEVLTCGYPNLVEDGG